MDWYNALRSLRTTSCMLGTLLSSPDHKKESQQNQNLVQLYSFYIQYIPLENR